MTSSQRACLKSAVGAPLGGVLSSRVLNLGAVDKVNAVDMECRLQVNLVGFSPFGRPVATGSADVPRAGVGGGVIPWLRR